MPVVFLRFFYTWIIYWLIFSLIPTLNSPQNIIYAFLLQLFFVIIVIMSGSVTYTITTSNLRKTEYATEVKKFLPNAHRLIKRGVYISIFGLLLNLIGKTYYSGINLFQRPAQIRSEWLSAGAEGANIFSILSYLSGFTFFASAILIVSLRGWLQKKKAVFYFISCLLLLIVNSVLIGGRSGVLLFLAMVTSCFFQENQKSKPTFKSLSLSPSVITLLLCLFLYVSFIFYDRAALASTVISEYVINFMPYLGFAYDSKAQIEPLKNFFSVLHLIGAYLTHSLNSFSHVLGTDEAGGLSIFKNIYDISQKLIWFLPDVEERFLVGRFLSLPGALFYQLGIFGLICGGIILGCLTGFVFKKKNVSFQSYFWRAFMEVHLILSPLVLALDFLFLPFILAGYFVLRVLAGRRILLRRHLLS
ncbi:oligosaccharide repeat unit polymerase [Alphaproteobacteria bacterium]|nr:oligosaccharide repeat unit polymerase [Alphaproteobacteria bacterium]